MPIKVYQNIIHIPTKNWWKAEQFLSVRNKQNLRSSASHRYMCIRNVESLYVHLNVPSSFRIYIISAKCIFYGSCESVYAQYGNGLHGKCYYYYTRYSGRRLCCVFAAGFLCKMENPVYCETLKSVDSFYTL